MPRVLNKHKIKTRSNIDVNIMRPTKWGNPYIIGVDGSREEVVFKYRTYILDNPELVAAAKKELKGKNLICCCAPKPCHGDVLLEIANED